MKHVGAPVRYLSGEYGTVVVFDGDDVPEWVTGPGPDGGDGATLADDDDTESDT